VVSNNFPKFRIQQGGALIIFLLVLVLAGSAVLFSALDSSAIKVERDKKTASSLAEAKAALIGYALISASKPGTLPCTDNNNDGSVDISGSNNCAAFIGRLPWKQLGISMLRDSYGECLWYALSPVYRNQMTTGNRKLNPINSNTPGTITLLDDNETPLGNVNPVIAVVFAPNNPVNGQNRSGAVTNYCPGDSVAGNYLDVRGAVNNSTGNVAGNNYTFKLGKIDGSFNDKLVYITAKEFYPALKKRIVSEIVGNIDTPSGIFQYYQTPVGTPHNAYPCPASTVGGNEDCTITTGFVPYNDPATDLKYTALGSWLINNGWFAMTTYKYITATHIKITLADALGSFSCDANMNVVSCTTP
jgi:hypothetical protein